MSMELILKNYLNQPKIELGNRTEYVGASDVGQCPRKVVLSKTQPVPHDLQTLIRFERGNLVERIVENALNHAGIQYNSQVEVVHPEFNHLKAHLDFMFSRQNEIAILEAKSVSNIPDAPYPSWIQQIHFQMGYLHCTFQARPVPFLETRNIPAGGSGNITGLAWLLELSFYTPFSSFAVLGISLEGSFHFDPTLLSSRCLSPFALRSKRRISILRRPFLESPHISQTPLI